LRGWERLSSSGMSVDGTPPAGPSAAERCERADRSCPHPRLCEEHGCAQERARLLSAASAPPPGAFFSDANAYQRTTIVIDRFADGSEELVEHKTVYERPPCQQSPGCRAGSPDATACGFDPKTGLCNGMMP